MAKKAISAALIGTLSAGAALGGIGAYRGASSGSIDDVWYPIQAHMPSDPKKPTSSSTFTQYAMDGLIARMDAYREKAGDTSVAVSFEENGEVDKRAKKNLKDIQI